MEREMKQLIKDAKENPENYETNHEGFGKAIDIDIEITDHPEADFPMLQVTWRPQFVSSGEDAEELAEAMHAQKELEEWEHSGESKLTIRGLEEEYVQLFNYRRYGWKMDSSLYFSPGIDVYANSSGSDFLHARDMREGLALNLQLYIGAMLGSQGPIGTLMDNIKKSNLAKGGDNFTEGLEPKFTKALRYLIDEATEYAEENQWHKGGSALPNIFEDGPKASQDINGNSKHWSEVDVEGIPDGYYDTSGEATASV